MYKIFTIATLFVYSGLFAQRTTLPNPATQTPSNLNIKNNNGYQLQGRLVVNDTSWFNDKIGVRANPLADLHVNGDILFDTCYASGACVQIRMREQKIRMEYSTANYIRTLSIDSNEVVMQSENPDGTIQRTQQTVNATNQSYTIGNNIYISGVYHDTTGSLFPFVEISIFNDTLFGAGADEASIQLHKDSGHPDFEWQLLDSVTDTLNTTNIHAHGQLEFDNDGGYQFDTPDTFIINAGETKITDFAGSSQKVVIANAAGTLDTIRYTNLRGYKAYTALVSQDFIDPDSTSAPTAVVLENTIGAVQWTWDGAGQYSLTSSGLFTVGKTFIITENMVVGNYGVIAFDQISSSIISVYTAALTDGIETGTYADDVLDNTSIEIRVYY